MEEGSWTGDECGKGVWQLAGWLRGALAGLSSGGYPRTGAVALALPIRKHVPQAFRVPDCLPACLQVCLRDRAGDSLLRRPGTQTSSAKRTYQRGHWRMGSQPSTQDR